MMSVRWLGGQAAPEIASASIRSDPERTLTDEDADAVLRSVIEAATGQGWTIRD